jgi:hypothetical protein
LFFFSPVLAGRETFLKKIHRKVDKLKKLYYIVPVCPGGCRGNLRRKKMKKDSDETMKITRLDNTGLQIQEELQEHKSEDKEDCFAGNSMLEIAFSQGLI